MQTITLYTKEQIQTRIQELATQITNDYGNQSLVLISILQGSFILTADLLRALYKEGMKTVDVAFMQVSSYGDSHVSTRNPKVISDVTSDVTNKHVLVVDDIIDTGYTLAFVKEYLSKRKAASVKILALLDKKEQREVTVFVDYIGFTLQGTPWVEGYGLDDGEYGRGRPDIALKKASST